VFTRLLGLGVAITVGVVVLLSASGALATTNMQRVTSTPKVIKINVSSRAAVTHYLRSIHVNAKHAVIQRGLHNYAGARCPDTSWTCASTNHTVVQIAKAGGQNRFVCKSSKCVVVQLSGIAHGEYLAGTQTAAATASKSNTAFCVKTGSGATTGGGQVCAITQSGGPNLAGVYENTQKVSGLVQTAQYSATIKQTSTGSNSNTACVTQNISLDGSTSNTNGKPVTVNLNGFQTILIKQDSPAGANSAQQAATSTGACDNSSTALAQSQTLTSTVSATGNITQNQDTAPSPTSCVPDSGPQFSGCANVVVDIEQNQNTPTATGTNVANFTQTTDQRAVANAVTGKTVTQQQDADVANPPYSGIVGTLNQLSSGLSTATVKQDETQCEDATNTANNNPPLTQCSHTGDPPGLANLFQTQYGPHKGYGQSKQTGAASTVQDSFTLSQVSHQYTDNGPHTTQKNTIQGDCLVIGGTCQANQQATLNGQDTIDVQSGTDTNVNSTINCPNGHPSCTKTLSAPKITQQPDNPSLYGSGKRFEFQNADPTVTFLCSLDGAAYGSCDNVTNPTITTPPYPPTTGYENTSGLASGKHTLSVETQDSANPSANPPATATIQWVITPPDPSLTASSEPNDPALFTDTGSFKWTDADNTTIFKCSLDGAAYGACVSGGTGASWSGLQSGSHTFSVKAYDSTGTYVSTHDDHFSWVITPPDPTISSGPGTGSGSQTTSQDANFVFSDADSTVKYECKLDAANSYTACPSSNPTYSNLSHGPHLLDVKATDSTGNYESTGFAEYTWEVIPYVTFEVSDPDFGATAGWSDTAGSSPITLHTGTDDGTYAQFTIHDRSNLKVSDLASAEPSFNTDTYVGAPRYDIELDNGDYLFGYPPQAGFGPNSWDINCGGSNLSCTPAAFVTWDDVQTAEGSATITDVVIEADFPTDYTYSISDFSFDGYGPSDVAP
jgi:hypothetical protein